MSTERDNLFFWTKLINGIGILFGAVGPVALKLMARGGNEVCNECSVITCPYGPGAAFTNGAEWNSAWGAFPDAWYSDTQLPTKGHCHVLLHPHHCFAFACYLPQVQLHDVRHCDVPDAGRRDASMV